MAGGFCDLLRTGGTQDEISRLGYKCVENFRLLRSWAKRVQLVISLLLACCMQEVALAAGRTGMAEPGIGVSHLFNRRPPC